MSDLKNNLLSERDSPDSVLVPVKKIRCSLQYALDKLPGAQNWPFLAKIANEKLEQAANILSRFQFNRHAELVIFDAFRTKETQSAIFNKLVNDLMKAEKDDVQTATIKAKQFVRDPNGFFPHGSGGAVDVSLLFDGALANMGTDFDDFSPKAARDFYLINNPRNNSDYEAAENRNMLRSAMEKAGFVGIDSEWWHYEYGTPTWSKVKNQPAILVDTHNAPLVESSSDCDRVSPRTLPFFESGVAQIFLTASGRRESLSHKKAGHYYARTSHPNLEHLEKQWASISGASHVALTPSGLKACQLALECTTPVGSTLIFDKRVYYEVHSKIIELQQKRNLNLKKLDFADLDSVEKSLAESIGVNKVVYLDNPRNWFLDSFPIRDISNLAKKYDAFSIVDTSVQPVQNCCYNYNVDLELVSLSKYPSNGRTLGGAISSNDKTLIDKFKSIISNDGVQLSPEAAFTISSNLDSLTDRIFALSFKAEIIANFLNSHDAVKKVRIPNPRHSGGLAGGQVSFHLKDPRMGGVIEEIVGHNSISPNFPLKLACTFGSSVTTIEHFASNVRLRDGIPREATNEVEIPDDMIRLGIGNERLENIIDSLRFVLNQSKHIIETSVLSTASNKELMLVA